MENHYGEIPDPEREPLAAEGLWHCKRDNKERPHAADQEEAVSNVVGRDRIRQPRVAVVHPPDDGEHHDHLGDGSRSATIDQHSGQLGDREDEDEVEEELERRDACTAIGFELRHGRIFTDGVRPDGFDPIRQRPVA